MTSETLPLFRADVSVSVQSEGDETYLILNDQFGIADGPIMVHSDMIALLEQCDGHTTYAELAERSGVELDGPEMLQTRGFISQLDGLGFFETPAAAKREQAQLEEWTNLDVRPPICSGSTYPEPPDELRAFLDDLLTTISPRAKEAQPAGLLIPHIDFRVAPTVYGPAFNTIRDSQSELVVMIGTSHYWSDQRVILTRKHQGTPLGDVETDIDLVNTLENRIAALDIEDALAYNDLAHRPEHSLELHAVFLKHIWSDRDFKVLPILVTGFGGEHDPQGAEELDAIATAIKDVVVESGKSVTWLISGDLAHVGHRFGDEKSAHDVLPRAEIADQQLMAHLHAADTQAYHRAIEGTSHEFRVCGHAPTYLALRVFQPTSGTTLAYDVWDDSDTESAVTFASVAFE